ncbi:calcium/calmodulin-dependent protein kinase type 1-like isoform X2 [Convolutriloba macropyga]|uniref:calcium/calmodulin-dependent protein kinase type 1-like isoform X2 n=1 Tax=Convolutriloba macropyga TaxID=536237 RepID=UPI003F522AA1
MAPTLPPSYDAKYKLGKRLGKGAFSEVFRTQSKEDKSKSYAVKVIEKARISGRNKDINENVKKEIQVMRQLKHKNIVCIVDYLEGPKEIFIIMDLAEGGELFDRIIAKGSYTEEDAANIIHQVLEACRYLHVEKKVVHRDIKPENILFKTKNEDSEVMLSDFGLSYATEYASKEVMTTACGTPGYCAPEILKNRGAYTEKVDCWSVGVVCYILLCGYPPFPFHEDDALLFKQIMKGAYTFSPPEWDSISTSGKEFVRKLLNIRDAERLSAVEAMKHEWIQGKAAKVHLTLVKDNLEKTQAFKKWKKVLNTVRAFPPATTTSPVQGQQSSSAREPSSNNNSRSNDTPPVNNNQNNNNNNNAENSANKNK